jgi:hypothetical protein
MAPLQRDDHELLSAEFDRQVENLLAKGYPAAAALDPAEFLARIAPLKARLSALALVEAIPGDGYIPFVLVIASALVPADTMMPLVERQGKSGLVKLYPREPQDFAPIDSVRLPAGAAYLLADIDRGKATINLAPSLALPLLQASQRSPLTIDEGIAILTHFPDFLQKNNCFSLLASRCGDRRVPALWLSAGRPKLGWCWDGNPHTWLGSASCVGRLGDPAL